jgi:hypothetical protein
MQWFSLGAENGCEKEMTGLKRRCWASETSPCKGTLSREHYLSRGIFQGKFFDSSELDDTIKRSRINADDLVVRCLCEGHNNAMSPLDQTGVDFVNCLHEANRLHSTWKNYGGPLDPVYFTISGRDLQRWSLKTAASGWARQRQALGCPPSAELARLACGLDEPPQRTGLALLGRVGETVVYEEKMSLEFGVDPGQSGPSGMILRLWGCAFYVTWQVMPEGTVLATDEEQWQPNQIVFGPKAIRMSTGRLVTCIRFDWSQDFEEDQKVVQLRRKRS